MNRFFHERALSIAQQTALLKAEWPSLDVARQRDALEAKGILQPTPISAEYTVSITYRIGGTPKVYVHDPPLARRPEAPLDPVPHVYPWRDGTEGHPCLYRPWSNEWNAGKPISRTIVPWLLTWLANYEIWRATGKWLGGGAHLQGTKAEYT